MYFDSWYSKACLWKKFDWFYAVVFGWCPIKYESEKQHFRHILLFYYRKGKNAVQARKKLSDVYGEDVLTERQCQNWFAKFRSGNFDVEDAPRSGRPVEADEDTIKALIDANRRITTREIAERLNLSNSTVHDHLKRVWLKIVFHFHKKKRNYFPNNLIYMHAYKKYVFSSCYVK